MNIIISITTKILNTILHLSCSHLSAQAWEVRTVRFLQPLASNNHSLRVISGEFADAI